MTTTLYGIKNCDTMKKSLRWVSDHAVDATFHDYKKDGVPADILRRAISEHGWNVVINTRGTTWRKLPQDVKDTMDDAAALKTALENPSIIKRPLLIYNDDIYFGFKPEMYQGIFKI